MGVPLLVVRIIFRLGLARIAYVLCLISLTVAHCLIIPAWQ